MQKAQLSTGVKPRLYAWPTLVTLWCLCTLSALALVWSTHQTRGLVNQLLLLRSEENRLRVAHGQYVLQERSLTSVTRLEQEAKSQLNLRFPVADDIRVLTR